MNNEKLSAPEKDAIVFAYNCMYEDYRKASRKRVWLTGNAKKVALDIYKEKLRYFQKVIIDRLNVCCEFKDLD